eukprot:CAMPEP_0114543186 /NCGR_PEP_ID=MMETSP0114-20121206/2223_1 /TAXON_ID=31324 /ORGANISM="Goniomonas sp, Strain m" /LENGTH=96 /DNA_ID=CAMNT_0001727511 /DNA_START=656 /DNA_END=946 /DNA_ORIENTATION=+
MAVVAPSPKNDTTTSPSQSEDLGARLPHGKAGVRVHPVAPDLREQRGVGLEGHTLPKVREGEGDGAQDVVMDEHAGEELLATVGRERHGRVGSVRR